MVGAQIRLRRIFPSPERHLFSVPLDHSVSMGPIDGLEAMAPLARDLQEGGVDLLIVTKGAVRVIAPTLLPSTLLGVHLSASTTLGPTPDRKVLVGTVAEAVALGADLVSVQVNFGAIGELEMLTDLGSIVDQARALGVPTLCMTYLKGPASERPESLRHACRAVADLGADIVKTAYPGSEVELRTLVATTPVPVLIGGGERAGNDQELLARIAETVRCGCRGICIGRNLFQRRPVVPLAREFAGILHGPARSPSP